MGTYLEAERQCQATFQTCSAVFHAYTSGKEMPILFTNEQDLTFAMNVIAAAAFLFMDSSRIIAFALMNNHLHFIITGRESDIEGFFNYILKKLKTSIPEAGRMALSLKPIEDLAAMRNNIVYTNRNGFVANPGHTPFSYPWGTGRYYFNNIEHRGTYADIPFDIKRSMIRGRAINFPEGWQVAGFTNAGAGNKPALASGQPLYIAPISFCDIQLGMDMFRDAHHYFAAVSKNVEAYNNIAVEINDGEFLTDQELFAKLLTTIREKYNGSSTKSLTAAQRLDLARTLHYDYHSSNGQIRRILGLTQFEVDSLFPLRK